VEHPCFNNLIETLLAAFGKPARTGRLSRAPAQADGAVGPFEFFVKNTALRVPAGATFELKTIHRQRRSTSLVNFS
jgi:hypothetical protein